MRARTARARTARARAGRARRVAVTAVVSLMAAAASGALSTLAGAAESRAGTPVLTAGALVAPAPPGRPGPDVLYAPPTDAPQLDNAPGSVWHATPTLISGTLAYRQGELVYQDYLFDDHGAALTPDPADPRSSGDAFSRPNGTYTYPSGPGYRNDAADLVELRVKPLADATAFRFTMNTLADPSLIALGVALGDPSSGLRAFPDGAHVSAPAQDFLTVHPDASGALVGAVTDATSGAAVTGSAPTVTVDLVRRQVQVLVPHSAWDPTGRTVTLAAGVGLWNSAAGTYLLPGPTATATAPGGAGATTAPAAFFNVAFRTAEPMPVPGDLAGDAVTSPAWWRDRAQGAALAAGDLTPMTVRVDFTRLASGVTDDSTLPTHGPTDRIMATAYEPAQGVDYAVSCTSSRQSCLGPYQSRLQPYALYIPDRPVPVAGWGLNLQLHALATNYNLFLGTQHESLFGDRGDGSLVLTPEARGPDGFYASYAEADTFEAWDDVSRHFPLDPTHTTISGTSMGGIGTFKIAEQFPDLFAKAHTTVGESDSNPQVASLRNVPFLMWNMGTDELVPPAEYLPTAMMFDSLGYRYRIQVFTPGEHLTLDVNDEFHDAAAFLGNAAVDPDPAHVTYVRAPALDHVDLGINGDHAYWLTGIALRPGSSATTGTIDVVSRGFGAGDPPSAAQAPGAGTLSGGHLPYPLAYASMGRDWGPTPAAAVADALDVTATGIGAVTVDATRARVTCAAHVNLISDGPTTVTLADCPRAATTPGTATAGTGSASAPVRTGTPRHPASARPTRRGAVIAPSRALAATGAASGADAMGLLLVVAGGLGLLLHRRRRGTLRG